MEGPTQLGKYRLIQLLATGGMGEVHLAKMQGPAGFAKTVVVKKVLPHLARDPNFVEMFLNEARLAAVLTHPNIVQIFELGEEAGTYFIAMEFVNGRSLKAIKQALLDQRQIVSPIFAARVIAQALNGLHYAHTLRDDEGNPLHVVHRDMSPDNVLVTFGGEVKVVDFGIAKASNAVTTTRTGTLKGKYAYMAPEQLMGQAVDARADLFSVGVVLYELLTGVRPFRANMEPALIQLIIHVAPKPPHAINPNVPEELSEIVMRALEKKPRDRFQSAEEMSLALERYLQSLGQPLTATHVGSLLKQLFPDGDRIQGTNSGLAPTVPPPLDEADPTSVTGVPLKVGSSPSLVKPLPQGASSPELPSASQQAQLERLPAPPTTRKVLLIAGLAGAGVGLLGSVAVIVFRPSPAPVVVMQPAPIQKERPPTVALVKPEPVPEPVIEKKVEAQPTADPTVVLAKEEAPPDPKEDVKPAVEKKSARNVPARPGKVSLRVNPYAEVFYAGKSLGVTPLPPVEVPAGTQTFTLKNAELKVTRKVTVKVPAGGSVVLKADLFDG